MLGGPARCQDTYQDWISLYCWAPFHAALMAAPAGSRCHWDQISRWVGVSPGGAECPLRAGPLRGHRCGHVLVPAGWSDDAPSAAPTASSLAAPSCWPSCSPAPGPAPSSTPSSCRSTLNTSPTARWPDPPVRAGCPPGWPWLRPWGWAASCPSQPPSRSAEPGKGLKCQRSSAQPLPAPVPVRGQQQPPSPPALGANERDEWAEGEGDRAERGRGSGCPRGMEWVLWHGGRMGLGLWIPASAPGGEKGPRRWVPSLLGPSPPLGTPGPGQAGSTGGARLGRGEPQALAGSHHPVPAHPVPSRPLRPPGRPR